MAATNSLRSVSFVVWLVMSSCLGIPVTRMFSVFWDTTIAGARVHGIQGATARRRRELGGSEGEDWEMEARRRPG